MVPDPFHAVAHQVGKRAREQNCQISLVCYHLPDFGLLGFPPDCLWSVNGWLESTGRRRCAFRCFNYLCDRYQCDAISLPTLLAQVPPYLGLFTPAPAFDGPVG